MEWWQTRLADWGYTPVLCSADQRIGLTDLTSVVKNRVTVILGPSGVGKSSLINALRDQKGLPLWYESDQMRLSEMLVDGVDRAEVPALQVRGFSFRFLNLSKVVQEDPVSTEVQVKEGLPPLLSNLAEIG